MHQPIDSEFGNIGQLDGRGGRANRVLFLSMQLGMPNVAKFEESLTAILLPFSLDALEKFAFVGRFAS